MRLELATAPVSWGVDFADAPGNPPWVDVLDGIAATGLRRLELGPVGYLPEDPVRLRAELEQRGLRPVGSFAFEPLHDPAARDAVLRAARRACAWIAATGGRLLVVLDRVSPERAATAGRPDRAQRLDAAGRRAMIERVHEVAAIAHSAGLRPVLHPHAGSHLEFRDEVDEMLEATGLELCVDTGHLTYAGIDPVELIGHYAGRIGQVHLKDVDLDVLAGAGGFWDAVAAGVFRPVGSGSVDFPAVLRALGDAGYRGTATLEQDRVPGGGDPVADVRRSVAYLAPWIATQQQPR